MQKTTNRKLPCKDRVESYFEDRMEDIRKLFYAKDNYDEEIGYLHEYGLSIDFVEAGTFKDQREDYYRYQLSWGGPSEEFRIYKNGDVEFWLLDWFDGACVGVYGEDARIIKQIVSLVCADVGKLI